MKSPLLLLLFCAAATLSAQTTIRLHGSTTVKSALEPHQAALERQAGATLEFSAFGTSSGLLALAEGTADVAMLSSPLEEVVQRINEKAAKKLEASAFHAELVGSVRLAFIVNPRNTVRQLSAVQLAGIFSGEIANWRDVGGASAPIVVVTLANAGPLVEERLLGGRKITSGARHVPSASQIPPVVAQDVAAIGIVSAAHPRGKTSLVTTDAEIVTPLLLVTKGPPATATRQLIDAARAALAAQADAANR